MKTKCGHKVLVGDYYWLTWGKIWEELTNEKTIVVVFISKTLVQHDAGAEIPQDYWLVMRFNENRQQEGIQIKLKELKGELKTIVDEKLKSDNT